MENPHATCQPFRHYPQLYSRLGFSHHYRAFGREELLLILDRHWKLTDDAIEAAASILVIGT